jgi:hypothetical protein
MAWPIEFSCVRDRDEPEVALREPLPVEEERIVAVRLRRRRAEHDLQAFAELGNESHVDSLVFTVEQRDALRERVLTLAHEDERVVAGAAVGSLALGGGDRYSDLDLTFAVADDVRLADVLDDWSRTLTDDFGAVQLIDLERAPTIYRVFLLPDALQFDLSLTPASRFAPAGPRWRTLFGEIAEEHTRTPTPPEAADLFGWGIVYALHARTCIDRGRLWQAEHYVGAVRDHALSLACLQRELPAVQARGYDDLPAEVLARFDETHTGSHEPDELHSALSNAVQALITEAKEAQISTLESITERMADRV